MRVLGTFGVFRGSKRCRDQWALGFGAEGLGFRVWGLGFSIQGFGFRV